MSTLATLVAVWRLIVRFRVTWTGASDWLMLGGVVCYSQSSPSPCVSAHSQQILNFVACVPYCIFAAQGGQGRLKADPFWLEPGRVTYELHIIFISQTLNVYAMFLVKASIVAFLMALDLGSRYRIIIWISLVIVVLCNFVMMLILHFAYCRPYWSRWDSNVKGIALPSIHMKRSAKKTFLGKCWPASVSEATAYVQIASNVITDLV